MVEVLHQSPSKSYVLVLNYTGLKLPLVSAPRDVSLLFRAPTGTVTAARAYSPDTAGASGPLTVTPAGAGQVRIVVHTDQFELIELDLTP
jgi:hypothetical protein